jgi:hypothetical protein
LPSHTVLEDKPPSVKGKSGGQDGVKDETSTDRETGPSGSTYTLISSRSNLSTHFDLKTLYISNVIKKF